MYFHNNNSFHLLQGVDNVFAANSLFTCQHHWTPWITCQYLLQWFILFFFWVRVRRINNKWPAQYRMNLQNLIKGQYLHSSRWWWEVCSITQTQKRKDKGQAWPYGMNCIITQDYKTIKTKQNTRSIYWLLSCFSLVSGLSWWPLASRACWAQFSMAQQVLRELQVTNHWFLRKTCPMKKSTNSVENEKKKIAFKIITVDYARVFCTNVTFYFMFVYNFMNYAIISAHLTKKKRKSRVQNSF